MRLKDKVWMGLTLKHNRLTPEVHQWSNTAAPNTLKVTITRTKRLWSIALVTPNVAVRTKAKPTEGKARAHIMRQLLGIRRTCDNLLSL